VQVTNAPLFRDRGIRELRFAFHGGECGTVKHDD
jgi:hypothetical protein